MQKKESEMWDVRDEWGGGCEGKRTQQIRSGKSRILRNLCVDGVHVAVVTYHQPLDPLI